jgi:serine/threonine-protein kinase RsbW
VSLDLELRATRAEIAGAGDELRAWAAGLSLPPALVHDLALVLDEVLANLMMHGYRGDPGGWIGVHAEREGDAVRLEVRDRAPTFDPRDAPQPDLTVPLDERPVGGLGISLVRSLVDEMSYARVGNENRLALTLGPRPDVGPGRGR